MDGERHSGEAGRPGSGPGGFTDRDGFGESGFPGIPRSPNDGDRHPSGPSRAVVLISLSLAALAAIGAGTAYALIGSANPTTLATAPPTGDPTGSPTSGNTSSTTSETVPATTTRTTSTVTPTPTPDETAVPGPAPTAFTDNPGAVPGMDFGMLVSVTKRGAGAQLTVKRQQFLTGQDAQFYYAQRNQEPLDYAIVDVDNRNHTFTVAPDALIYAQYLLGDNNTVTTTPLTVPQFLAKAKAVQAKNLPLHLWLYHRSTADGTVVYLAEQFTP
jgi:hypothetical protein